MDLLFYSNFVKESIFRKCSYLWFTRSFRKMKASPSWLWRVCKCVQNYLWGPMASSDWKYQSIMVSLDIVPLSKRNRWEISFSLSAENPGLKSQASKSYNLSEEEMRNTEHFSSTVLGGEKGSNGKARPLPPSFCSRWIERNAAKVTFLRRSHFKYRLFWYCGINNRDIYGCLPSGCWVAWSIALDIKK